jgi:uncharacterized protein with HEPN domain
MRRSPKRDPALLFDMIQAAEAVGRFIAGRAHEEFFSDEFLRAAVERKIEIIGEACRGISDELQTAHPEIPWQKVIGTRHVLAHDYDLVNFETIWRIATIYVPALLEQI